MQYGVIEKNNLNQWFDSLQHKGMVYAPQKRGYLFVFDRADSFDDVSLHHTPTILSPKKFYLPQKELLFEFSREPFGVTKKRPEPGKYILFGVQTCDIAGIQCLDVVFGEEPVDSYYQEMKEAITIIGMECMDYCDRFASCAAVGTHVYQSGYDLLLTDMGSRYALHIRSEKGEDLITGHDYIREMNASDRDELTKAREEKMKRFHVEFDEDISAVDKAFDEGFFSDVWNDVGKRCVGCTNCTAVCPTCYCHDIIDELSLDMNKGKRYRIWNYCQMDDFAKVAGGQDFRAGRGPRQRHRYYRKFKYPLEKYNKYFCIGCGRCSRTCMAGIILIETVNSLLAERRRS
ncbi:MAG: 4Fe-4S dicluster domain-containing protein [Nitrospirota bacterium]